MCSLKSFHIKLLSLNFFAKKKNLWKNYDQFYYVYIYNENMSEKESNNDI